MKQAILLCCCLLWLAPGAYAVTTLFNCGFDNGTNTLTESDCFTSGFSCAGTCQTITSPVHSGSHAGQLIGGNNATTFYFQSFASQSTATYYSGWLYLPTGQPHSVTLDSANLLASDHCTMGMTTDASGNPSLYLESVVGTQIGSSATLTTGVYHCVDLLEIPGTSSNGTCTLRIDGVQVANSSTLSMSAGTTADITMKDFANTVGTWTANVTTNWDDFLVTGGTGATYGCANPAVLISPGGVIIP